MNFLDKMAESINNGMIFIYGSFVVFAMKIWKPVVRFFASALGWCAKVFVRAVFKEIEKAVKEWLQPFFDELRLEFDLKMNELKKEVKSYKEEKHKIEGENLTLKESIKNRSFSRKDLIAIVSKKNGEY